MKPYVKPQLTALSLSGNEVLCGGCADNSAMRLVDNPAFANALIAQGVVSDLTGNGPSRDDFINTFAAGESCVKEVVSEQYCKFTSNETAQIIIWS